MFDDFLIRKWKWTHVYVTKTGKLHGLYFVYVVKGSITLYLKKWVQIHEYVL